jgi:hypothetical protein
LSLAQGRLIRLLFAPVKLRSSRGATLLRFHSNGDPSTFFTGLNLCVVAFLKVLAGSER